MRHGQTLKTLLRLGLSIAALVVAALVLKPVYEDLDLATVKSAIGSLSAAEWTVFLAVFAVMHLGQRLPHRVRGAQAADPPWGHRLPGLERGLQLVPRPGAISPSAC